MGIIPFLIFRMFLSPGGFPGNASVASTHGPTTAPYTVVSLGTLGGDLSDAAAINQMGQIAGSAQIPYAHPHFVWQDRYNHAYRWEAGKMIDLGASPGIVRPVVAVAGMNNHGDVIGSEYQDGQGTPVLWSGGKIVKFNPLPQSTRTRLSCINDAGQIVGTSTKRSRRIATLWENGEPRAIGKPGQEGIAARGINNQGQIVGRALVRRVDIGDIWHGGMEIYHAVLWNNDDRIDLGDLYTPAGMGSSSAAAINDKGQVVGEATVPGQGPFNTHAFLWENGKMRDLGTLPGCLYSTARGVNNRGQVVGMSEFGGPRHAFLYEHGKMVDLNSLIPRDCGWELIDATGINDAGEICGVGWWRNHEPTAFLLRPAPARK